MPLFDTRPAQKRREPALPDVDDPLIRNARRRAVAFEDKVAVHEVLVADVQRRCDEAARFDPALGPDDHPVPVDQEDMPVGA